MKDPTIQHGASPTSHPLTLTLSRGERGRCCSLSFQGLCLKEPHCLNIPAAAPKVHGATIKFGHSWSWRRLCPRRGNFLGSGRAFWAGLLLLWWQKFFWPWRGERWRRQLLLGVVVWVATLLAVKPLYALRCNTDDIDGAADIIWSIPFLGANGATHQFSVVHRGGELNAFPNECFRCGSESEQENERDSLVMPAFNRDSPVGTRNPECADVHNARAVAEAKDCDLDDRASGEFKPKGGVIFRGVSSHIAEDRRHKQFECVQLALRRLWPAAYLVRPQSDRHTIQQISIWMRSEPYEDREVIAARMDFALVEADGSAWASRGTAGCHAVRPNRYVSATKHKDSGAPGRRGRTKHQCANQQHDALGPRWMRDSVIGPSAVRIDHERDAIIIDLSTHDVDVSNDGEHWCHLLGTECLDGLSRCAMQ